MSRDPNQQPHKSSHTARPRRAPPLRTPIDPILRDQQRREALERLDPAQIQRLPQGASLPESCNAPVRRSRTGVALRNGW